MASSLRLDGVRSCNEAMVGQGPLKCLVLFGDGFLQLLPEYGQDGKEGGAVCCPNLDAIFRDGSSGFLALRKGTFAGIVEVL